MPKYEIIASNRYSDTYIVTAKNSEQAEQAVYEMEGSEDSIQWVGVEIEHLATDCVGSDIFDCELIDGEEPEEFMCEKCYSNGSFEVSNDCGVWKCRVCGAHATYRGAEDEPGPLLSRCYCGWALDGGNGRHQLSQMGENVEDDY